MTDKWTNWNPFSGESPPGDYLGSIYEKELRQQEEKENQVNHTDAPDDIPHPNPWYRQSFGGCEVLEQPLHTRRKLRVVATGAGASGIQAAHLIGQLMEDIDLVIYERNSKIGGTWLVHRYPGCACDIPSHCYQFYWNRNPGWSSFYSPAEEILRYLQDTVDKFSLQGFFKLEHTVLNCEWNAEEGKWLCLIRRPDGTEFIDRADVLLNTSGPLSRFKWPDIPGLNTFRGKLLHTAAWDDRYSLEGKTVAVIGSGSTAIQVVPGIQPTVKKLINFVRSPVWLTPGFSAKNAGPDGANFEYTEEQKRQFRSDPHALHDYIRRIEEDLGSRYPMQHQNSEVQREARAIMEARMRNRIGLPEIANSLIPNFGLGCRRLSPGDEYMRAFSKENVQFVHSAAARFTEDGLVDAEGREFRVDVIICATGYDTTFVPAFSVKGRSGLDLKTFIGSFPRSYNGIMTPHFPNYLHLIGAGSPGSHGGVFALVEWQLRWVRKVLKKMQREYIKSLEPTVQAATDVYNFQHSLMKRLVFSQPCASWYKNGRVVGPVCGQYPGTRLHWHEWLRKVRYEDFDVEYCFNNRFAYLGNGYTQEDIEGKNLTWYFNHLNWSKDGCAAAKNLARTELGA